LTREISSSAGWQMMSLVSISGIKNGKEKKRNPRKERSRRKCLIHSILWQGQGKYFTMPFLEEESTYVNFPH